MNEQAGLVKEKVAEPQYSNPKFIGPEYTLSPLATTSYLSVLEMVPTDGSTEQLGRSVLKQYAPEGLQYLLAESDTKPTTLEGWRDLIKGRYETTRDFFDPTMPSLVVPTEILIGETEHGPRIHEVQKKVGIVESLLRLATKDDPVTHLKNKLSRDELLQLSREIESFVTRAREVHNDDVLQKFPLLRNRVFDIIQDGNIVIDENGHLKIFDTNTLIEVGPDDPMQFIYDTTLESLQTVADKLKENIAAAA